MADLTTHYMGLKMCNPVIVSSCDLTKEVSGIMACEEAGAGAVVLKSIFEEQFLVGGKIPDSDHAIHPEALDYMRSGGLLEYAPNKMCRVVEEAKKQAGIPIIASVNCQTPKLWPSFAKQIEEAGADGLELNIYVLPIDVDKPGADYEALHVEILEEVRNTVSIPVSVKLVSQITSIPYIGKRLCESGCSALVLFNWFLEPDIDVRTVRTRSMKGKGNFNQSLRWIGLLAGRVDCDLASSGGVKNSDDIAEMILAGASAVQACSIFYQKGLAEIKNLLNGLNAWMEEHQYKSIDDFRGELSFKKQELSFKDLGEAGSYFRAQYLKAYSK